MFLRLRCPETKSFFKSSIQHIIFTRPFDIQASSLPHVIPCLAIGNAVTLPATLSKSTSIPPKSSILHICPTQTQSTYVCSVPPTHSVMQCPTISVGSNQQPLRNGMSNPWLFFPAQLCSMIILLLHQGPHRHQSPHLQHRDVPLAIRRFGIQRRLGEDFAFCKHCGS